MKDTVYITQKVHDTSCSSYVFLADILDFRPGDMVKLTFHKKGDVNRFTQSAIKRVVKIGNSQGCYIGRRYGVGKGDILVKGSLRLIYQDQPKVRYNMGHTFR